MGYFIGRVHQQSIVPMPRPRIVVGIPTGATEVEKRAVFDATMAAGAREVYLIEEPIAASLGAGLPLADVKGTMIIDIGGGTTEVAITSMGGIVVSRSLRVAGDELDQDIINFVRNKYNVFIGERMAEQVKIEIGSAYPLDTEKTMTVRGRNLVTGLPEAIEISSIEVREALTVLFRLSLIQSKTHLMKRHPKLGLIFWITGFVWLVEAASCKGLLKGSQMNLKCMYSGLKTR